MCKNMDYSLKLENLYNELKIPSSYKNMFKEFLRKRWKEYALINMNKMLLDKCLW